MSDFLYTHGDCAYDDVCGCESLKGLPRWQFHLLALPITRTTAKRIYYRFPEGHWRDDEIEHYVDRAKFAGTRRPGEAWVKTSNTTGYHLFLTPNKPEWFYDHADEGQESESQEHTALVEHLISEHFVGADAPLLNDSFDDLTAWHVLDHQFGIYKHVIKEVGKQS